MTSGVTITHPVKATAVLAVATDTTAYSHSFSPRHPLIDNYLFVFLVSSSLVTLTTQEIHNKSSYIYTQVHSSPYPQGITLHLLCWCCLSFEIALSICHLHIISHASMRFELYRWIHAVPRFRSWQLLSLLWQQYVCGWLSGWTWARWRLWLQLHWQLSEPTRLQRCVYCVG